MLYKIYFEGCKEKRLKQTVSVLIIAITCILFLWGKKCNEQKIYFDNSDVKESSTFEPLNQGNEGKQFIYLDHNMPMAIKLCFGTYGQVFGENENIIIRIRDVDGDIVSEQTIKAKRIQDHVMTPAIIFGDKIFEGGRWYCIDVSADFCSEEKNIVLVTVDNTYPEKAYLEKQGEKQFYNYKMVIGE